MIVNYRFDGNWSGFYCTGSRFPIPPELTRESLYVFPSSPGYDGQMYHYLAHDPLLQTDIRNYMDAPRLRCRRMLPSILAWLLAVGRTEAIDGAIVVVNLFFLFLGAWWLAQLLVLSGLHLRFSVLFAVAPVVLVSLDRLTVDLVFTALAIGLALQVRLGNWVFACFILAAMCLTRETGFLFVAGSALALLFERQYRKAAWSAAMAAPAAVWYLYVASRTPPIGATELVPLKGIAQAFASPTPYPFVPIMKFSVVSLDYLALAGFLLAVALTIVMVRRNGPRMPELTMGFLCVLGMVLPIDVWADSLAIARIFSPMMIYLALAAWPLVGWPALLPLAMVFPRIAVEVGVPLLGAIVRH